MTQDEAVFLEDHRERDFKKGDILRTRVEIKANPRYGEYAYGVCSGGGFGCRAASLGSAIFMDCQTYDLEEALRYRQIILAGGQTPMDLQARWERFWPLWILEEKDLPLKIICTVEEKDLPLKFICTGCGVPCEVEAGTGMWGTPTGCLYPEEADGDPCWRPEGVRHA